MYKRQVLNSGQGAVTASGSPISSSPSSVLYIGDSAITIAPYQSDSSSVFTYQRLTFTPLQSGVVVNGTTLIPGGSALTVAGTVASLGLGGDIADASQTAVDATGGGLGNNTAVVSAFTGGQPRDLFQGLSYKVGILLLVAILVILW